MLNLAEQPLFTEVLSGDTALTLESGSVYIYGTPMEERAELDPIIKRSAKDILLVEVVRQDRWGIAIQGCLGEQTIKTRGSNDLNAFLSTFARDATVYIDITSMAHGTWAPLVRAALAKSIRRLRILYAEPDDYARSPAPTEGDIFDLSESVAGIFPLPGFARMGRGERERFVLVPLLGFEGTRFAYIRETVQPKGDRIVPVVGLPGFRPEHPFSTYLGNRSTLLETRSWKRVRYARANCPFSLYYTLEGIHADYPGELLKIAPIGTKPHALGSILFALRNPSCTELVYDHPVRKRGRSRGRGRLAVYNVGHFFANRWL